MALKTSRGVKPRLIGISLFDGCTAGAKEVSVDPVRRPFARKTSEKDHVRAPVFHVELLARCINSARTGHRQAVDGGALALIRCSRVSPRRNTSRLFSDASLLAQRPPTGDRQKNPLFVPAFIAFLPSGIGF